ncbi:hypothetical protein [Kibdelosporangium phytohabitans]|uniref:hypothetical protein n=1 Tax=Kibdelosporangium phytohabitans TaxID=860235 RepID=UPI000A3FFFB9|nr:hypothetical protein [Kibdelosporangium phytohabitans]MBE1466223.1 hypothetical protein [Kibdelosporangium phytohabitans]
MRFTDPDGTARKCRYGCGLMTVLAQWGDGRPVRVHCGTWRSTCPGQGHSPPTAPTSGAAVAPGRRLAAA